MPRFRSDRSMIEQPSRKRWGGGQALRSLTGLEALEPRRLLATNAVPADTTRIDSSGHVGIDSLIKQGPGTLVVRNLSALGQGGVEVRAGAKLVLDGGGGRFTVPSLMLDPAGQSTWACPPHRPPGTRVTSTTTRRSTS